MQVKCGQRRQNEWCGEITRVAGSLDDRYGPREGIVTRLKIEKIRLPALEVECVTI